MQSLLYIPQPCDYIRVSRGWVDDLCYLLGSNVRAPAPLFIEPIFASCSTLGSPRSLASLSIEKKLTFYRQNAHSTIVLLLSVPSD